MSIEDFRRTKNVFEEIKSKIKVPQNIILQLDATLEKFLDAYNRNKEHLTSILLPEQIVALSEYIKIKNYDNPFWIIHFNGGFFAVHEKQYSEYFIRYALLHELGHIKNFLHSTRLDNEHNADVFAIKQLKKHWPHYHVETKKIIDAFDINSLLYEKKG